jgi:hypothetical protein
MKSQKDKAISFKLFPLHVTQRLLHLRVRVLRPARLSLLRLNGTGGVVDRMTDAQG